LNFLEILFISLEVTYILFGQVDLFKLLDITSIDQIYFFIYFYKFKNFHFSI